MGQLSGTGIGKLPPLVAAVGPAGPGKIQNVGFQHSALHSAESRRSDGTLKLGEEGEPTHDLLSFAGAVAPDDAEDFALFDL